MSDRYMIEKIHQGMEYFKRPNMIQQKHYIIEGFVSISSLINWTMFPAYFTSQHPSMHVSLFTEDLHKRIINIGFDIGLRMLDLNI